MDSSERVTRARGDWLSRSLLRSGKDLVQNRAILRKAARISFALASSEKQAAQHLERLRKNSALN
jgi:hypothetical protein